MVHVPRRAACNGRGLGAGAIENGNEKGRCVDLIIIELLRAAGLMQHTLAQCQREQHYNEKRR